MLKRMVTVATSETKDQHDAAADPAISTFMTRLVVAVLPGTRLIGEQRCYRSDELQHAEQPTARPKDKMLTPPELHAPAQEKRQYEVVRQCQ